MSRALSGLGLNEYRILGYHHNQKSSFACTCGKGPKVAFFCRNQLGVLDEEWMSPALVSGFPRKRGRPENSEVLPFSV